MLIKAMTCDCALEISGWTYENEYSVYSFQKDDKAIAELLCGDYYAYLDPDGSLTGYFCFGKSARIPTVERGVYDSETLDIGLGMRPNLCGNGIGLSFVKSGLDFAREHFGALQVRLTVAVFNKRAISVYEKAGFQTALAVTHGKSQREFYIMIYSFQHVI